MGDSNPQLRQRGTAQIDRCRSRQKTEEKQRNYHSELQTTINDAGEKCYDNKTTESKDNNIDLSRKLGPESSNIIIKIFVSGELEKSHIVAQS